ncbi:class I SAM-dependent methyltransferase [Saccharibacillus sp. JS10]|uniref:class I SAM-dependent DNA methyltransferase n=1 Tax=Saccharibacillus sp. JS10 TaxID=2950552 RepID=UPI00210C663C|nr:class I SAM-dependent methyltransferase [Saccharibacillus sp. JS10]MCQ4088802.1 class I SAM-dependent methyltransferase [Saccharibacillus sp. JS10]
MTVFDKYARYYDLLYKDKNYTQEAEYIHSILQELSLSGRDLLELGCGTAKHAVRLSKLGYRVHGVDLSAAMIEQAKQHIIQQTASHEVSVEQSDIRSFRTERKFDAVLSLFHVVSYQNSYNDLEKVLETAYLHLEDDSYFIFDCWHGPAVLSDPPVVRVKHMQDEHARITRIAEPKLLPSTNTVHVKYDVFIEDRSNGTIEKLDELHIMRYFFEEELSWIAQKKGFEILSCVEFETGKMPGTDTWNVIYVLKKR